MYSLKRDAHLKSVNNFYTVHNRNKLYFMNLCRKIKRFPGKHFNSAKTRSIHIDTVK